jgi:hypothetical protein
MAEPIQAQLRWVIPRTPSGAPTCCRDLVEQNVCRWLSTRPGSFGQRFWCHLYEKDLYDTEGAVVGYLVPCLSCLHEQCNETTTP